jgi:hypothetical protein
LLSEAFSIGKKFLIEFLTKNFSDMHLKYPITRSVLAKDVYKVRPQTFTAWLKEIGITHKKTLSPRELRLIIRNYELPTDVAINIPAAAPPHSLQGDEEISSLTQLLREVLRTIEDGQLNQGAPSITRSQFPQAVQS